MSDSIPAPGDGVPSDKVVKLTTRRAMIELAAEQFGQQSRKLRRELEEARGPDLAWNEDCQRIQSQLDELRDRYERLVYENTTTQAERERSVVYRLVDKRGAPPGATMSAADVEPPNSVEAERALLGGVMLGGRDAFELVSDVAPRHFYRAPLRVVWSVICDMRGPLDNVLVREELSRRSLLDKAGGPQLLVDLVEETPGWANVRAYADVLVERGDRRRTIQRARAVEAAAFAGDLDDLRAAVAALKTTGDGPAQVNLWSLGDLYDMPDPDVPWLVDRLMPCGGLSLLVAPPKAGKSTLARCLAVAVATGRDWLGRTVRDGPVVHLALEESLNSVRRHYQALDAPRDTIFVSDLRIAHGRIEAAASLARATNAKLLIVDTLQRLLSIEDGNDYAQVSRQFGPLIDAARDLPDCHILCIHHSRKSGGEHGLEVLGSTALSASVDTVMSLARDGDEGQNRVIYGYGRDDASLEKTLLTMEPNGWVRAGETKRAADQRSLELRVLEIIEAADAPMSRAEIKLEAGCKNERLTQALRNLHEEGAIEMAKEGRKHIYSRSRPI